jgi:CheY-like chemotaxis protein
MPARRTILIVEDDDDLRRLYRRELALEGFDVREARAGFEALRMLEGVPPDLVVLDLSLPGIDGVTVRQELAAQVHTRQIPIVVVTGSVQSLDHLDVACILRKPVLPGDLVNAVHRCLASGAPPMA